MHDLHITHMHLRDASARAYAADWNSNHRTERHLIKEARDSLVMGLSGEPADADRDRCRAALIDLIAMAILDSNDIDATHESQAEAVLDAILDNCLAFPPKADSEAASE